MSGEQLEGNKWENTELWKNGNTCTKYVMEPMVVVGRVKGWILKFGVFTNASRI